MYDYINSRLKRLEDRWGIWWAGGLVGLVLFAAACVYVRPGFQASTGLGQFYAELARHPFDFNSPNPVGYRFLTPLISYVLGLRGEAIVMTNLLIAVFLIVAVYWCARRLTSEPADAFVAASVITFSLVTLTTVYYSGFCDSLSYLLIFFMWWWREKYWIFWLLFLLGIFNRESVVFLTPWFLYIRSEQSQNRWWRVLRDLLAVGAVGFVVWLVRSWQSSTALIDLDEAFYFDPLREDILHFFRYSFPESMLGFTTVYKILWAIPVVWGISLWRGGRRAELTGLLLLILCAAAQLLIAWDSSRLFTMAFMVVPISLFGLFRSVDLRYRAWIFPLLIVNILLPEYYTAEHTVEHLRLLPDTLFRVLFLDKGW